MIYDVAIIGCGPAGLSAAIFCARAQLKTLVFGNPKKSQLYLARHIENYFGFPTYVDGRKLLVLGRRQAKKFGVEFNKEEVVLLQKEGNEFILKTEKEEDVQAKSIIIATGIPIILSGIKNESELTGKGVSYCISCDAALYRHKRIVVIGNGNHAAEDAVEASSYSDDVTLISNSDKFVYSKEYQQEIEKHKIKLVNKKVAEFVGKNVITGLKFENGEALNCDVVFMASGTTNALDFANEIGLEVKDNIIVVDENDMTNIPGIFAAGNCMGCCRQIAKNVGDGCNAAVSVIKYLKMRNIYMDFGQKVNK